MGRETTVRRSLRLLGVAVLAWLMLLGAGSALGAQDPAFGVNVQTLVNWSVFWPSTPAPPEDPYLSALSADGVGVARTDAPWYWVQPSSSSQLSDDANWSQLDAVVTALARNGLRWQPVIDLAPDWAAQTPYTPSGCTEVEQRYLPPQDPAQFGAFAGAVAKRYGAGGTFWAANPSLPDLPVTQYEIWNEPNVDAYWNNNPDPAQYVAVYNAARTAIRAQDPAALVLVGGLAWGGTVHCTPSVTNDNSYIKALFADGGSTWAVDGIAVHPYGPAVLNIVANLRREQQALVDAGRTDVPLNQSELGWPDQPPNAPAGSDAASYPSDASRAATLSMSADVAMGSDCNVHSFDAYTVVERESEHVQDDPSGVSPYDLVEHWMGMFKLGATEGQTSPATTTSTAYQGAITRDLAGDNSAHKVPVCAPVGASGGQLLTVALSVAPASTNGCFNATVTYLADKLPVYGAQLTSTVAIKPAGSSAFGPAFTDTNGVVGFCVPSGKSGTVTAVVGGGSFDPDLVPLVAKSTAVAVSGPTPPPNQNPPPTTSSSAQPTTSTASTTSSTATGPATTSTTGSNPPPSATPPPITATEPTAPPPQIVAPVVSPPPACVLSALRPASERSSTAMRSGLRVTVGLATIASSRGCALSLVVRLHSRVIGTAHALLTRAGNAALTVRLTRSGRRALRGRRNATLTVRLDLANAPVGLNTLSTRMHLRS